jgi:hypothetical protein
MVYKAKKRRQQPAAWLGVLKMLKDDVTKLLTPPYE